MRRRLSFGPYEADFDAATGWLRAVRLGGVELVQAIYGAVRDRNWGTIAPRMETVEIRDGEGGFQISFDVECVAPDIDFSWHGKIVAEEDGVLTYRFVGEARKGFWRNRIGVCVLHPADVCEGKACRIEAANGAMLDGVFPRFVAPHQPFKDVRAMAYEVAPGLGVELRFTGEIFETEDQRNWTDASFKTYGTPLDLPFPVWIEPGTRVEQTVTLRMLGWRNFAQHANGGDSCAELSILDDVERSLPDIGFGAASHGTPLSEIEATRLRELRPAHLRVDLDLSAAEWRNRLRLAAQDALAIGAKLHLAVFLSDAAEEELSALAAAAQELATAVSLWLIFHKSGATTSTRWVRLAEAALPAGATLAAGTNANFAELNRARPDSRETALPCYSINPQVHAFDDESLIENLGGQAATVESVRQFAPRPIVISPITLRPRFNVVATGDEASVEGQLPPQVDERQMKLIGATWTVGSLAKLATKEGIHSLTYFETTGWLGLMETALGSPCPGLFRSVPAGVFPLFQVFAWLASAESILATTSTHPRRFDGLCIIDSGRRRRWIVANLTADRQCVRVRPVGEYVRVEMLEAAQAGSPGKRVHAPNGSFEFELHAYAVAQITTES
jgi:D-apionolactonase